MENFIILTKDFVANESAVVDIKSLGSERPLRSLLFRNKTGQSANFIWQKNIVSDTGYFKEIINELGVKVAHYDGFITITNGGGIQHLKAELSDYAPV